MGPFRIIHNHFLESNTTLYHTRCICSVITPHPCVYCVCLLCVSLLCVYIVCVCYVVLVVSVSCVCVCWVC